MPDDRLLHPRQGFSAKLSVISHLAYRVWTQYLLSADDYGVMPCSAALLRGANLALARETEAGILNALEEILSVDLVHPFVHQGQKYLCSLEWQDFQKVAYPRQSYYPHPSAEVVPLLSDATKELFQKNFKKFQKVSKSSRPHRAGDARIRQANGLRLTANGKKEPSHKEGANPDVKAFIAWWQWGYQEFRGSPYAVAWKREAPMVAELLKTFSLPRLKQMAMFLWHDEKDQWIASTPRGIGILRHCATTLAQWVTEAERKGRLNDAPEPEASDAA